MAEQEALSPEEFARWLSAPQAIEALRHHLSPDEAAIAIWSGLKLGEIRSAARRIEVPQKSFPERALIPVRLWQHNAALENPNFWKTSSIEIRKGTGESFISMRVAALFGVRFDPAGIATILEDMAPVAPDEPAEPEGESAGRGPEVVEDGNESDLPDVDFEHLKLWYEAFVVAYPKNSEKLALTSARGMFPDRFVRRQWVRDLFGERRKGRPLKGNDS